MDIVHIDDALIVVDKPAGLLSVPGRTEPDCAVARLQQLYPEALTVHRLDQATSGLLLFARGPDAQRELSLDFAKRRVHKRYVALVMGHVEDRGWQEIALPLIADWPNRPLQKVDHETGKPSLTRWRVMAHEHGRSRLELEPVTGRSHQLRVHLKSIGHPIVGDTLYGGPCDGIGAQRLMLHAALLELPGRGLRLESSPDF